MVGAPNGIEPSIKHVAARTASTGAEVSVKPAVTNTWYGAAKSASGTCFYIKETSGGPTAFASGTGSCDGTTAATVTPYEDKW